MSGEWSVSGDFKRLCARRQEAPDNVAAEPITRRTSRRATRSKASARTRRRSSTFCPARPPSRSAPQGGVQGGARRDAQERIKAETTGLFESASFRATLMGLLTPREGRSRLPQGGVCVLGQRRLAHLDARAPHRGGDEGDLQQYTIVHARLPPTRKNCAGDYEGARGARRAARARSRAASARRCPAGSRPRTARSSRCSHTEAEMKALRQQFEGNKSWVGAQGRVQRRV